MSLWVKLNQIVWPTEFLQVLADVLNCHSASKFAYKLAYVCVGHRLMLVISSAFLLVSLLIRLSHQTSRFAAHSL